MVNYFAIPNKEIKISDTPLSYIITPKRKTNQHDVRMFLQSETRIHISLFSHRIHWPRFMQNFLKYFLLNDAQKNYCGLDVLDSIGEEEEEEKRM